MLPDSRFLFSQGELDSEFDGRRNRLRQAVKDLDAADMAGGDQSVVDQLVVRFDLREVTIHAGRVEIVTTDDAALLRIPFTGSGVLLHRSPGPTEVRTELFPGRVMARSRLVDGQRVRDSWIEIAVPDDSAPGDRSIQDWRSAVLAELAGRVGGHNERLAGFRSTLRESAREAVRLRRTKLARLAARPEPDATVADISS
jgi:hypothetical protein